MTTTKNTPAVDDNDGKKQITRYKLDDGSHVDVDLNRASALIAFERETGHAIREGFAEDAMKLAWIQAGHPGGTGDDAFLEWADAVEEVEAVYVARPTKSPRQNS